MDDNAGLLAVSTSDYTTDAQVMEVIRAACVKLKVEELFSQIKLAWSAAPAGKKRHIGCATYKTLTITLSTIYWPHLKPHQRLDTIRHEVAHLACRKRFGYYTPQGKLIKAHGKEWRLLCRIVGCKPRACEQEGVVGADPSLAAGRRRKVVYCACGESWMSTIAFNRMESGVPYSCRRCKTRVSTKPLPPKTPVVEMAAKPLPSPLKMSANDLGLLKVGTVVLGFYGDKAFKYIKKSGGWVPVADPNASPMTNGFFAQMPDGFAIDA